MPRMRWQRSKLGRYVTAGVLVALTGVLVSGCAETGPTDQGNWATAKRNVGEDLTVCGPVVSVKHSDGNVFINVGLDYPEKNRFVIVLWNAGDDEPEGVDDVACASGHIVDYKGVAQIQMRTTTNLTFHPEGTAQQILDGTDGGGEAPRVVPESTRYTQERLDNLRADNDRALAASRAQCAAVVAEIRPRGLVWEPRASFGTTYERVLERAARSFPNERDRFAPILAILKKIPPEEYGTELVMDDATRRELDKEIAILEDQCGQPLFEEEP